MRQPCEWKNVDEYPDAEAGDQAFEVFRDLATLDPEAIGAEVDTMRGGPPFLRFDEPAQDLFDEWRGRLENEKLRTDHEMPLIENHLSKYRSLMPSLALLFHLIEVAGGGPPGPVTFGAAQLAAGWCDFLEQHARRIYEASVSGDPEPASRLAERIRRKSLPDPFTARMVAEHNWSGLATQEEVDHAVATLERLHWVRSVTLPTGGRSQTWVFVNPLVWDQE